MNQIIHQPKATTDRWWEHFYDDACLAVLADQDQQQIQRSSDLIVDLLQVKRGDTVMDQCCGLGQYSIEIAARGFEVVGIDQSPLYIQHADREANQRQLKVDFLVADALEFVRDRSFDGVFNWHSSFGYLPTDRENVRMLQSAHRCLRPGGRMLLEYPNMIHLVANFQTTITTDLPDGLTLTRHSQILPTDGILKQRWSYRWPDGSERHHHSSLRIYLPHQLIEMLKDAAFTSVELYSGDGATLQPGAARCIAVAKKEQADE